MTAAVEPERYRVVDLVVDVADATVSRASERIALPPRTFELLLLLVRRHPHLVRRHEILDAVWPSEHVTDQTLTHRVLLLRQALGDHAEAPRYVAGERGWGYRLLGPVARLDAPSLPATQSPRRAVRYALGAVALGGLLVTVADPRGGSRAASDPTLAVKPLSADGLSSEMRSVATDLTEALHARLAGLDGVRVLPWSAGASPPTLLLEGRVGTAGERLDVRLRLVDTATGRTLWSEGRSGKAYQVLSAADALIGNAASAAASRLGPAASPPESSAPSPQVRRLCLRGEFHWLAWDAGSFAASRDAYAKAVALEPENAPAHAGLALALCGLALAEREEGAEAAARQAAARARAIAPRDASTLLAGGLVRLLFDRDARAAEAEMHRALEAAPGELPSRMALALALQAQGRFPESVALLQSAALVDPDAGLLFLQARGLSRLGSLRRGDSGIREGPRLQRPPGRRPPGPRRVPRRDRARSRGGAGPRRAREGDPRGAVAPPLPRERCPGRRPGPPLRPGRGERPGPRGPA